jgi:tetratricopeptide (TPR) repeat protein
LSAALLGASAPSSPDAFLERAEALYQQNDYERARAELERGLEALPEHDRLLYNRAVLEYADGNFEDAAFYFGEVCAHTGDDALFARASAQLGNAYIRLGEQALAGERVREAVASWHRARSFYETARRQDPDNELAAENAALAEEELFGLLVDQADLAIGEASVDPDDPSFSQAALDALKTAYEWLDDADRVRPDSPAVASRRAEVIRGLTGLMVDLGDEHMDRALAFIERNQWGAAGKRAEGAVKAFQDALSFSPDDARVQRKLEEAKALLARILNELGEQIMENAFRVSQNRNAHPMHEPHLLKQALDHFEKALGHDPEHEQARRNRDQALERLAQLHEERGDQAAEQARRNAQNGQGPQPNQWSQALRNYQDSLGYKPADAGVQRKSQEARENLMAALKEAGRQQMRKAGREVDPEKAMAQMDQALQFLSRANSMSPGDAELAKMLSKARGQWQQMREAMEAYRQMQMAEDQTEGEGGDEPRMRESVSFAEGRDKKGLVYERWAKFNTEAMRRPVRDW